MSKDLTVFVDGIGRTVVGEVASENKTTLSVKNPAILHVQPNATTGQIQVQLIPFFFKEFAKGGVDDAVTWDFLKTHLVRASNLELDERLITQYTNMYSVVQTPAQSPIITPGAAEAAPVVKLFDD
jgi:hypothetical protein